MPVHFKNPCKTEHPAIFASAPWPLSRTWHALNRLPLPELLNSQLEKLTTAPQHDHIEHSRARKRAVSGAARINMLLTYAIHVLPRALVAHAGRCVKTLRRTTQYFKSCQFAYFTSSRACLLVITIRLELGFLLLRVFRPLLVSQPQIETDGRPPAVFPFPPPWG